MDEKLIQEISNELKGKFEGKKEWFGQIFYEAIQRGASKEEAKKIIFTLVGDLLVVDGKLV